MKQKTQNEINVEELLIDLFNGASCFNEKIAVANLIVDAARIKGDRFTLKKIFSFFKF